MAWNVVTIDRGKKSKALASASIGYGRIGLNVSACKLLENYEKYKYVELLTDSGKPSLVGIRFLVESTEESIAIRRKIAKGKEVGGMEIPGRYHMEKLFGIEGTQKKTTVYSVTKEKEAENILVIHTK